ncbi:MAG: Fe-S cluster assembly protein SufD [Nitrospira sp.]|nr:Fe-S cluster assembly protein SufD [Nitrospira sp.]
MKEMGPVIDHYRSDWLRFQRESTGSMPEWIKRYRQAAGTCFADMGFPTSHHEERRYTDVTPVMETPFAFAWHAPEISKGEAEPIVSWVGPRHQLTFVNGHFAPSLSLLHRLPQGVIVGSLRDCDEASSSLLEPHLGRHAWHEDHAFVALNAAFLNDGAFLYLPAKMAVEEPILVLFLSSPEGQATISHPRVLVVAGPSSQATVIEGYVGMKGDCYFTNAVTEVVLGEEAVVNHHLLQEESQAAYHIATLAVHQERNSTFMSHSLALGGALARIEVHGLLADEGSTCTLRGLYAAAGRQHVDIHTRIEHARRRCTSRQLYNGILGGHARGVFDGRVLVRQDAHKTDASQTNKNLLLSEDAVVHSTPQLEIFADDVKCVHGTTVGQLDPDALFYLRSRGLDLEDARRVMTQAFSSELFGYIGPARIRDRFTELLSQWTLRTSSESLSA